MIDKSTSEKITLTVLLATVTVVVRHSFNAHIYQPNIQDIGPRDVSSFLQLLNIHSTASAVPMFFLLSGYLFFHNLHSRGLLRKWHGRLHSLAIPYLLWNTLYLVLFLLVVPHVSFIGRFSAYDPLVFNVRTIVEKLTIDPPSSHFWFVRDLIGCVALAPLFCLVYRRPWLVGAVLTSLLVYWRPVDRSIFSSEGLLFFFAGGWAGYRQRDLGHLRIDSTWISGATCILWLGLCLCQTVWLRGTEWNGLAAKMATLLGVVALWLLADWVGTLPIRDQLLRLAPYTFFIYAAHMPMVKYIYKVLLSLAPMSQYYGLLVYVITPVITIAITVCAAGCLYRYGGNVYPVLTGGRVPPRGKRYQHVVETTTQPA